MLSWIWNFFKGKEKTVAPTMPPVVIMAEPTPKPRQATRPKAKQEARKRPEQKKASPRSAPGKRFPQDPSQFGTCKHCRATLSRSVSHYCPTTNTQYDSNRPDDFLLGMVMGQATGNPFFGGMGGVLGAQLHDASPSAPDNSHEDDNRRSAPYNYESHQDNSGHNDYGSSSHDSGSSYDSGCSDSGGGGGDCGGGGGGD